MLGTNASIDTIAIVVGMTTEDVKSIMDETN